MLTPLRSSLVLVLLALAVVLVSTPGAAQAKAAKFPSISTVTPKRAVVGSTLRIRGKNFRQGTRKNTVVFKRSGRRPVFVRAGKATTRSLSVKLPTSLNTLMTKRSGREVSTRMRVRVIARRLGRRYTSFKASPIIGPATARTAVAPVATATKPAPPPEPDCNSDGIPDSQSADDDGDLLSDTLELSLNTEPCDRDTDGDGAPDGFEFYSARDLNGSAVPFPGKQPYPNALDASDAGTDHDGDGLSLKQEALAWRYTGAPLPLSYSDGKQKTDGVNQDADRDVDGDGVGNWIEANGPLSSSAWWSGYVEDTKCSAAYVETIYAGPKYDGLSFVDTDSDGDGIPDGADDIDHDGLTNAEEGRTRRADWCDVYVSVGPGPGHDGTDNPLTSPDPYARINPFNPCKPVNSGACHRIVPRGYYVKSDTYIEDWLGPEPSR